MVAIETYKLGENNKGSRPRPNDLRSNAYFEVEGVAIVKQCFCTLHYFAIIQERNLLSTHEIVVKNHQNEEVSSPIY